MSDRQPTIVEKYRPILAEQRDSEREMMELADKYLDLRRKGELLVASALDRVDMSPEDEHRLLSYELVLIAGEAERAVEGDESAEERIAAAMKDFLRHLSGRRGRRGAKMVADANGEVEAALDLLKEVRTARRGMIEALREEVSKSGDIEAAKECCKLLEEEIGAARASKDAESERIATASLEVVRRLAEPEEAVEEDDEAVGYAQALISNKDIAFADRAWAVRTIRRYLAASTAADPVTDALQSTIREYRGIEQGARVRRDIRDLDPLSHLLGRI